MKNPENSHAQPEVVRSVDPNGLASWENDLLGISAEERAIPHVELDAEKLRAYCHDLQPNGKSEFENDFLGISEEDRLIPQDEN